MKSTRLYMFGALAAASLTLVACASVADSATGSWGVPEENGQPSLTLEEDGSLHGSDGCNNLMGSYEVKGTEVIFGQLASTLRFCEGVDTWLLMGNSATVEGDTLTVFDTDGTKIGTLNRTK